MGFAIAFFIFGLTLLGSGYYFARLVIYPRVMSLEESHQFNIEYNRLQDAEYQTWPSEPVNIHSQYGYDLVGIYHALPGAQRTVVVTHGITDSRFGSVIYAELFYRRGWNVLLYDIRHHGRSGGHNTSFGFYEKQDITAAVNWALTRLGPGGIVGSAGVSLGAATALQHAAIDPRIAFCLADCPYSDLPALLAYRLRQDFHLPAFPLIPLASFVTRLVAGWSFDEASPIHSIARVQIPVFLVHGSKDTYIPPKMTKDLYEAKQTGCRRLYLAAEAGHAQAITQNPDEYARQLDLFLQEIGLP